MNDTRENILNNIHKHNQKYIEKKLIYLMMILWDIWLILLKNIIEMALWMVLS